MLSLSALTWRRRNCSGGCLRWLLAGFVLTLNEIICDDCALVAVGCCPMMARDWGNSSRLLAASCSGLQGGDWIGAEMGGWEDWRMGGR